MGGIACKCDKHKSRKLRYGALTSLLIATLFLLTGINNALEPSLAAAVTGLVSVFALYCGANVGHKFVDKRSVPEEDWSEDL